MGKFVVEERGEVQHVPIGRLLTVGRSQSNDLVLHTPYASRRHAWVWRQGSQVVLEDLGSTHGTYVNSQRLAVPRFLNHNDVVLMGGARLTFVDEQDPASERTPPHGLSGPGARQVYCTVCGTPNQPQARYCGQCGRSLGRVGEAPVGWRVEEVQTAPSPRPSITPTEPVVARPFPQEYTSGKGETDRRLWILILLLAALAVVLVTIVAALWVYTLG
jgi:hypothetical protein